MKPLYVLLAGLLLATPAARAQWALQPFTFQNSTAPYSPCVAAFSIATPQAVWAIALNQQVTSNQLTLYGDNEVAHTSDGGTTWTVATVPGVGFYSEIFNNVVALSSSTALLCTSGYTGSTTSSARILKTGDGGATWTTQTTPSQFTDPQSYPTFFFFFSPTEGICLGEPTASTGQQFELYRTTDAGTTWTAGNPAMMPGALAGEYCNTAYSAQVGDNVWFTTSAGRAFHSADRGRSWTTGSTRLGSVGAISFRDATNGLAYAQGSLVRTTDGGATWQPAAYTGPVHRLLAAVPGTGLYLSAGQGPDAGSSYSADNGATWTPLETTRSHFALAAYNATTVWSGAVDYAPAAPAGLGAYKLLATTLGTRPATTLAPGTLSLYPNPSPDGRLTVRLAAGTPLAGAELRVFDALGRCVRTSPVVAASCVLDLGRPAPGRYTVQLCTSQGVAQQPLAVQ